ncbi:MAG: hypothetical protein ABEH65_02050 [Halobacteriales archaeon]
MVGPIQTVLVLAIVLIAYAMIILAVLGYAAAAVIGIGGAVFTVVSVGTAAVRIGRATLGYDDPRSEIRAAISFPLSVIGGTGLGVGGFGGAGRVLTVVAVEVVARLTDRDMAVFQEFLIDAYGTLTIHLPVIGATIQLQFWQAAIGFIVGGGILVVASDRIAPEAEDPEIEEKTESWQPSWMRDGFGEEGTSKEAGRDTETAAEEIPNE